MIRKSKASEVGEKPLSSRNYVRRGTLTLHKLIKEPSHHSVAILHFGTSIIGMLKREPKQTPYHHFRCCIKLFKIYIREGENHTPRSPHTTKPSLFFKEDNSSSYFEPFLKRLLKPRTPCKPLHHNNNKGLNAFCTL